MGFGRSNTAARVKKGDRERKREREFRGVISMILRRQYSR